MSECVSEGDGVRANEGGGGGVKRLVVLLLLLLSSQLHARTYVRVCMCV